MVDEAALPEMTDVYHKARRSYGLFSGLLLAWELIGVEVSEAPLLNVKVVLKSPQAVPYVLIALVLYFAFRTSIEWYQCNSVRRALKVSRVDFTVAHILGALALGLYATQRVLDFQVADEIGAQVVLLRFTGAALFGFSLSSVYMAFKWRWGWSNMILYGGMALACLSFFILGVRSYTAMDYSGILLGILLGGGGGIYLITHTD